MSMRDMYRKIQDGEVHHRKSTSYLKPRVLQPFRIKARWESKPEQYKPRDVIAIDINERKIVYGNHEINKGIDTDIDRAYRWKVLAENLQKKYSSPRYLAWRRRKAILNRIRSYHRKARNVLEDWARKTSLKIVRLAVKLQYALAREDHRAS